MMMNQRVYTLAGGNLNRATKFVFLNTNYSNQSLRLLGHHSSSSLPFLVATKCPPRSILNGAGLKRRNIDNLWPVSSASFHTQTQVLYKDPESKAEKTVNILKENIIQVKKEDEPKQASTPAAAAPAAAELKSAQAAQEPATAVVDEKTKETVPARLTLWQRVVAECKHYYHGFKLLYFESKIAWRLMKKVLQGHSLTRRERRQFTRTAADLFRLVPFSVFIIVPFMEFTLPIFLKLFPNMLPSTFNEESKVQENLKKRLKAKLEMAKFLQDTLEETALKGDENKQNEAGLNQKFAEFMKKIRTKGEQPTSEDILKYSSLFENELTLDNLTRQQLIALCQILDVSTLANIPPNHILRFQLRMKIRSLEADDKMIIKEGIDSLDTEELQQACRDRGMRAIGVSETRLRNQLSQWLDLHINRKIPISLLMLSRAMYLPENLAPEEVIKSTISALPKTIENATIAKIAEAAGEQVDNKVKLELLKQEEAEILKEQAAAKVETPVPAMKPTVAAQPEAGKEKELATAAQFEKEKLVDKAKVLVEPVVAAAEAKEAEVLTPTDIKEINAIIENLPVNEKKQVKAEIAELKKDITEYKEDVKEVEEMTSTAAKLTETKSAKILSKRVQKLLKDMDKLMVKLEQDTATPQPATVDDQTHKNTVSIDELMATIKRIRGVSDADKEKKLMEVLQTLDQDRDGKIDDLNDVLKVFDMIEQENVKVTKEQMGKLLTLLEKEKLVEIHEEQQEKAAKTQEKAAAASTNPK